MNSRAVAFGDADALVQSWPAAGHLPAGRLVVPFTGSMASHTALRYAGAYAASTEGACICAVTARRRLSLRTARRQMSQFVTATIRATADQQIGCQAVARSLRRALVALACHPADLLVLGTPGADGDRDGAVRRYCLERARCPVLLTPSWLAGAAVLGPEQLAVQRAV
jgi:nucleotide-binding universal stress UspA family protein